MRRSESRRSSVRPMDAVDLFVPDGDASRRSTPLPQYRRPQFHQSSRFPEKRNDRPLHPPIRFGRAPPFYHNERQLIFPRVTYHCILCNMSCTSEDVFESHVIGQKHLKKLKRKRELQQQGVIDKVHQSELYCKLCNVELTNHDHMAMHMNGRKHKQNARKAGEQVNVELDCDLDAFAIPEDKKKDIPPMPAGQTQVFDRYCKHCDKFLSGKSQVLLHIKSHKHRMKVGEEIPAKKKKDRRLEEIAAARKSALEAAKKHMRQRRPVPSYPNPMIAPLLKAFTPFNPMDPFMLSDDVAGGFGAFGPDDSGAEPMQFPPFEAFCGDIHRAFGFIDEDEVVDYGEVAVGVAPRVVEEPKGLDAVKPLFEIPDEPPAAFVEERIRRSSSRSSNKSRKPSPERRSPDRRSMDRRSLSRRSVDKRSPDRRSMDRRSLSRRSVDKRSPERRRRSSERRSIDKRSSERRSVDRRSIDRRSIDKRSPDRRSLDKRSKREGSRSSRQSSPSNRSRRNSPAKSAIEDPPMLAEYKKKRKDTSSPQREHSSEDTTNALKALAATEKRRNRSKDRSKRRS